jgi:hypothetical protein
LGWGWEGRRTVPGGELRTINDYSDSIEIEMSSPFARYEPLRSLVDIARGDVTGLVLTGMFAFTLAIMKERVNARVERFLDRRRKKSHGTQLRDPVLLRVQVLSGLHIGLQQLLDRPAPIHLGMASNMPPGRPAQKSSPRPTGDIPEPETGQAT